MTPLLFLGAFVGFAVLGVLCWAASELPLALRDTALNTRRDADRGPAYTGMLLLGTILRITAAALWLLAVIVPLFLAAGNEGIF